MAALSYSKDYSILLQIIDSIEENRATTQFSIVSMLYEPPGITE